MTEHTTTSIDDIFSAFIAFDRRPMPDTEPPAWLNLDELIPVEVRRNLHSAAEQARALLPLVTEVVSATRGCGAAWDELTTTSPILDTDTGGLPESIVELTAYDARHDLLDFMRFLLDTDKSLGYGGRGIKQREVERIERIKAAGNWPDTPRTALVAEHLLEEMTGA